MRPSVWIPLVLTAAWATLVLHGALAAAPPGSGQGPGSVAGKLPPDGSSGCITCHQGIEDMHPAAQLSCVDCHGGDASVRTKRGAHVEPKRRQQGDERVADLRGDLAWRRFKNPMDLRVVDRTCGDCHEQLVEHLESSLHGTTAGHISDGYYEVGLHKEKQSPYGIFPVKVEHEQVGGPFQEPEPWQREERLESLEQVPPFMSHLPRTNIATHFSDLVRKECMQCHLWSEGRAVRGRVGFDGDYRGEGCAACHVPYAIDGLSESADRTIQKNEPGHPIRHSMTRAPKTDTCTSCHYGDASIGLHFRGLSQLPPGAPGGPEVPGTTSSPLNRTFYIDDDALTPPDVHHEKGMHCIDCHTMGDVMGDGQLHGAMEDAVEISCSACHGTFTEPSTLTTERGTPLDNLVRRGEEVFLKSKVTGAEHKVTQVVHVLDPERVEFNPDAVAAMTPRHADVECYTCHAGWNINFLGFHFDRNETLTQLDLISGRKTRGRVTTQEKVFSSWKSFYAGLNESGRVAPYLTGFSTMGSVTDKNGDRILDQVLPETAVGLSGLTMVHHQMHTTRPTARSCVECHRSSATWGMGSTNFRLARQLAFVADRRGIEVVAIDRANLPASMPLAKVVLPDVIDLEIQTDHLQGRAQYLFAAEGGRGIHVIDVREPSRPRHVEFVASVNPRGMQLCGEHLYSADGFGGLKIYDVSNPRKVKLVSQVPMFDAHAVTVQWPYAYVADGPGGLSVVDVRAPIAPQLVAGLGTNLTKEIPDAALDVAVLFQNSRPLVNAEGEPVDRRRPARNLCAVLDENAGLVLVDVTEPTRPERIYPKPGQRTSARTNRSFRGLALKSHVDLASPQGGTKTSERDYAYLLVETAQGNGNRVSAVAVVDVEDPKRPRTVSTKPAGLSTEYLAHIEFYNQPFLQSVLFAPGLQGVRILDVSISAEPNDLGALQGLNNAYVAVVEEFPLDKMLDEDGRRLKDVSHAGSRWLYRSEIEKLLSVPGELIGTVEPGDPRPEIPGGTARLHFQRMDRDRSGFLEGREFQLGGGEKADANADGRISLLELASSAGALRLPRATQAPAPAEVSPFMSSRSGPDGDLARLLDGVNPYDYDRDNDRRLGRSELGLAMFAALDLDDDKRLTLAELSRHPGELRQLRYGGEWAEKRFEELDYTGDDKLGGREFKIDSRDWAALDEDADGYIQLRVQVTPWERDRGFVGPLTEWPARQTRVTGLPPVISVERLLAVFDADDDRRLTKRELKRRDDLLYEFDRDGDSALDELELGQAAALVAVDGVDATQDGFYERWDLDRDGEVEKDELPLSAALLLRLGEVKD